VEPLPVASGGAPRAADGAAAEPTPAAVRADYEALWRAVETLLLAAQRAPTPTPAASREDVHAHKHSSGPAAPAPTPAGALPTVSLSVSGMATVKAVLSRHDPLLRQAHALLSLRYWQGPWAALAGAFRAAATRRVYEEAIITAANAEIAAAAAGVAATAAAGAGSNAAWTQGESGSGLFELPLLPLSALEAALLTPPQTQPQPQPQAKTQTQVKTQQPRPQVQAQPRPGLAERTRSATAQAGPGAATVVAVTEPTEPDVAPTNGTATPSVSDTGAGGAEPGLGGAGTTDGDSAPSPLMPPLLPVPRPAVLLHQPPPRAHAGSSFLSTPAPGRRGSVASSLGSAATAAAGGGVGVGAGPNVSPGVGVSSTAGHQLVPLPLPLAAPSAAAVGAASALLPAVASGEAATALLLAAPLCLRRRLPQPPLGHSVDDASADADTEDEGHRGRGMKPGPQNGVQRQMRVRNTPGCRWRAALVDATLHRWGGLPSGAAGGAPGVLGQTVAALVAALPTAGSPSFFGPSISASASLSSLSAVAAVADAAPALPPACFPLSWLALELALARTSSRAGWRHLHAAASAAVAGDSLAAAPKVAAPSAALASSPPAGSDADTDERGGGTGGRTRGCACENRTGGWEAAAAHALARLAPPELNSPLQPGEVACAASALRARPRELLSLPAFYAVLVRFALASAAAAGATSPAPSAAPGEPTAAAPPPRSNVEFGADAAGALISLLSRLYTVLTVTFPALSTNVPMLQAPSVAFDPASATALTVAAAVQPQATPAAAPCPTAATPPYTRAPDAAVAPNAYALARCKGRAHGLLSVSKEPIPGPDGPGADAGNAAAGCRNRCCRSCSRCRLGGHHRGGGRSCRDSATRSDTATVTVNRCCGCCGRRGLRPCVCVLARLFAPPVDAVSLCAPFSASRNTADSAAAVGVALATSRSAAHAPRARARARCVSLCACARARPRPRRPRGAARGVPRAAACATPARR
jgi:hypothetical protein